MKRWLWMPLLLALLLAIAALPAQPERNFTAEAGLGLIALALGLGSAYPVWTAPLAPSPDEPPEALRPQVQAIAALDATFAAGTLEEAAYRQQRAQLKQALYESLHTEDFEIC